MMNADTEPLRRIAVFVATIATAIFVLVDPALNLLVEAGVAISPGLRDAIVTFVQALTTIGGPLAVAQAARPSVTPIASPTLQPGTEVTIEGTEATTIIPMAESPSIAPGG